MFSTLMPTKTTGIPPKIKKQTIYRISLTLARYKILLQRKNLIKNE